jgi:ribosomal-protein-alanine N-acetyltransferase
VAIPVLRYMTVADVDAAMLIERQAFRQPWSRHMYLSDLQQNRMASYLVVHPAAEDSQLLPPVLAYGGMWLMVDEAHIATVASHPGYRGCGLGQWLMLGLLEEAVARGAFRSTLEVRVTNAPAISLYQKLGYEMVGMRRHYYQDGENAYIMTTPLLGEPALQARLRSAQGDALAHLEKCFRPKNDEAPDRRVE